MDTERVKLTVFFEGPFWVGVFERISGGKLSVCKVTFGAEPKDYEVWALETEVKQTADHPKRRQRSIRKQLQTAGVGTRSQQALKMQREEMKTQRKRISKEQRENEKQRRFDLKQQKRKMKHRGH